MERKTLLCIHLIIVHPTETESMELQKEMNELGELTDLTC